MDLTFLGSYAMLFFTASDLTSITSHIRSWMLILLWLHPFILSGVISPLISSSVLDTYQPGEFLFQYPIILPFHTVHEVLKARILKWFAIPFSSGPHSVRLLEKEMAKHFNILAFRTPYLGIYLPKETKDLYIENYKTL